HPASIGAEQDSRQGVPYLRFSAEALSIFREWRQRLEARLRSGDLHPAMEAHLAKYRKLIPALALIIHVADAGEGPVNECATGKALAWGEYLESHAVRIYASVTAAEYNTAKAIAKKIKTLPARFTARDVRRKEWAGVGEMSDILQALDILEDLNWLRSGEEK